MHHRMRRAVAGAAGGGGATYTAKSFVIDAYTNWGENYPGLHAIEFKLLGELVDPTSGTSGQTSILFAGYEFDSCIYSPVIPLVVGTDTWLGEIQGAYPIINQRLWATFTNPITFDEIIIQNYVHPTVDLTGRGVRAAKIYITEDTGVIPTAYGAAITGSSLIYDGEFKEHSLDKGRDDDVLLLV